jgi:glycosyl hydrolase family 12
VNRNAWRLALLLLVGVVTLTLTIAAARAGVAPSTGVKIYNAPMCGPNQFVRVKLPASEFTIHDSAASCVKAMRHRLDFQVTSASTDHWQYPNISSGYELGESSCASRRDTCYRYPVQARNDGAPVASVKAWLAPGVYNLSFDIWFTPVKSHLDYSQRAGGTEVMVWLADPGIGQDPRISWHATIDGVRWGVMTWETGGPAAHRYLAYIAPRTALGQLSVSKLWLNPVFRNAEAHGYLRSSEWLTAIDLGFELYSGGVHDNIHAYTLAGVR